MSTHAVTAEASAASSLNSPGSMEEAIETGFLPDDPHYRLTGEFKSEKEDASAASGEEKDPSGKEEASAASGTEENADTAAASAAASTQEKTEREKKGPAESKSAQSSESRWQKITRENREMREENARLKAQAETRTADTQRDTKQTSQPAAEAKTASETSPRPKIDDVDPKTGKPKYATYGDYEAAKDDWLQSEAIRKFQETSAKRQREQEQQRAEQTIAKEWDKRVTEIAKKYPDYMDVCFPRDAKGVDLLHIPPGSVPDVFFLKSQHGAEVLYQAAKNHPDIFATRKVIDPRTGNSGLVYVMDSWDQARELLQIEIGLARAATSDKSSVKPVTQAPRPVHQVSGSGTVSKDAVEEAVEASDFETYSRVQNARELARRKGK